MGVFCYIYLRQVFISMGRKIKVRLTEQELIDLISKHVTGTGGDENELVKALMSIGDDKTSSKSTASSNKTSPIIKTGDKFTQLNLNTPEGLNAYSDIADKFIQGRSSNLLNINGDMLANAAKNSFNKFKGYVPPELALAQLSAEGGFSNNSKSRPIRTKNPFNVGNVDSGKNVQHGSVQDGIQSYYDLISKKYLGGGKDASDLLTNFVNSNGQRYASSKGYENIVKQISSQVNQMAQPIYASLTDKLGSGIV